MTEEEKDDYNDSDSDNENNIDDKKDDDSNDGVEDGSIYMVANCTTHAEEFFKEDMICK